MDVSDLLVDLYGRLPDLVRSALDGLDDADLARRPDGGNSAAWLLWHQARVQDHLAELMGERQLWETGPFAARFGMEPDPTDTGFGHTDEQVDSVRPDGHDAIVEYTTAVSKRISSFLDDLGPEDLDRVVDESYDPPVVLGVRLSSIAGDCLQHLGQAAYVRGMLTGR